LIFFVMLNPSIANETRDDHTLRRCVSFSKSFGFDAFEVVNLFALIEPLAAKLRLHASPIGPENDEWIVKATRSARERIVVAWGGDGEHFKLRARHVLDLIRRPVNCLGTTKRGEPRHPLYAAASETLAVYRPRG
jgi:hypothetical protein